MLVKDEFSIRTEQDERAVDGTTITPPDMFRTTTLEKFILMSEFELDARTRNAPRSSESALIPDLSNVEFATVSPTAVTFTF
jgi:hypothetical protein